MANSFIYTPNTIDIYEKANGDQIIIIGESHGIIAAKNISKLEEHHLMDVISPSEFAVDSLSKTWTMNWTNLGIYNPQNMERKFIT